MSLSFDAMHETQCLVRERGVAAVAEATGIRKGKLSRFCGNDPYNLTIRELDRVRAIVQPRPITEEVAV